MKVIRKILNKRYFAERPNEFSRSEDECPPRLLVDKDGNLGDLDVMPLDVIVLLLSFLTPKELKPIFSVSRKMNYCANHDSLWMGFFKEYCDEELPVIPGDKSWKSMFVSGNIWRWDSTKKAETIELNNHNRTASRPTRQGSNPAVMGLFATKALNRIRSSFEVKLDNRGEWIGIGFCEEKFVIHEGATLGTQSNCTNGSFFCQDNTTLRIQGTKERIKLSQKLQTGDRVKIKVNFNTNEILFYKNENLEGSIKSETKLEENTLYPCANLSQGTVVTLLNEIV